ncbi:Ig-like domain-containing protein [Bradyrhizobium sp. CCGUVB23]|uniref:Ig-like domain-containing protein n=1 Tax=Bradyrhizobium sp. CCGUVB23 TaxID=2949630 RepID=UPI0020B35A82|nr:Ig-like domain-containing protein [Bradyrhizobium sp. CCGUVB23]MCP3460039.1 Ig-like domain-containing protein [Bradyrhizobium sp. CCGUVB23]
MTYALLINGTSGADILFGGTGNDLLTGGAGSDLFVISKGYGSDTISDFQGGTSGDVLRVQNYGFATFASFMSAAKQTGTDVVVTLSSSETLTLQNVALSSLTAANVVLDNPLPVSASPNTAWTTVGAGGTLTGGAKNDSLQAMGDGVTLIGGAGDDSYFMYNHETKVVELAGQGIDTIYDGMIDGYSLINAPNVENLTLGGSYNAPATGNDLDNIIVGNAGNNMIDGGKGNDVLTGGAGSDTFVIRTGNGNDIITDFQTGAGGDTLQINGTTFKTLTDVTAAMQQVGTDVVLSLGNGEKITLENTQVQKFTTANINIVTAPTGLIQTFGDDFNSLSAGQDPHLTWKTNYAWSGTASYTLSGEQEVYVDPSFTGLPGSKASSPLGLNPFSIQDGHLVITAAPIPSSDAAYVGNHQFTSGVITTENSFVQTYGYFEMKATLPDTKGAWPAFWMLPINTHGLGTELDALEALGKDPDQSHYGFVSSSTSNQGYWANTADLAAGDHTFGVEWTPYTLTYFVDGVEVGQVATPSDMNTAMYMIANLAMGGSWAGNADPSATAQMSIDYIKAYQLPEYTLANYTLLTSGAPTTTIAGTADADTLTGTSGNDLLGGAGGADTMTGGLGDDTYIVTDPGAKVIEGYGGGVDTVMSSVSYTLPDYVENLTLTGSAAINGTGNSEANIIIGNDAANVITGGLGNDILTGGGGADTFIINPGDGSDIITDFTPGSAAGHDIVQLNGFAFTSFNDIKAAMTQVGDDVYLALTSQDTLVFRNTTISAFTSDDFQLPSTLPVGGTITSWISGSTSSHTVYGTAANDQITAVNADDTLVGWTGDDTYVIGNPNQKIIENPGGGIDGVQAWSSYTLPANVENLTLMAGGLTGVGNDLANRMVGSSGNDILNGAGGDDWLFGGAGNDTFIYGLGSGHDTIADFHVFTSPAAEHDKLVLKGYGASAYLTNVGDEWTVHYAGGTDSFRIAGVTQLSSSDYAFVSATGASMTTAGLTAPTISLAGATSSAASGLANANQLTLTGTAQAGVTIKVFDQTAQIGIVTADGNGVWSFSTSALADGNHSFTAIATDGAGDVSGVSTSVTITIDATAPNAPSIASFSPDSNIVGDGVTSANHPTLSGTAEAGSKVLVFDGTTQVGTATVDANGNWSFATGTLADGTHAFTGKAVDAAGNISTVSGALNVTVDTVAPNAPVLVSDALAASNKVVVSGTAEAGSAIKLYEGTTLLGTAVTASNGRWSVTTGSLSDGTHAFTATATDAAGNVSTLSAVLDPVVGTVIESIGSASLIRSGNNYYVGTASNGYNAELKFGGVAQVVDPTGRVTPLGAEKTATGYQVVWSLGSGQYSIWTTDNNGNETSYLHVSGTSSTLKSLETTFQQDLNGDGVIGAPAPAAATAAATTLIETNGSAGLAQIGNNFYVGTASAGYNAELKFAGVAQVVDPTGHVAPLGAEKTATGYQVVWSLGSGQYSIWTTDNNGNETSYLHVSGTSSTLKGLETTFLQDLNGDGVINTASTVLDISSKAVLGLSNMSQAVTIEAGATLELTGAVSGAVTFAAATGTLVLDHASQFTGKVYGLSGNGDPSSSDILDLKDISFGTGTKVAYSGDTSGGILTVADTQNHTAQIKLVGDYTHSTFNLSGDGSGGTLVIDPPVDQFNFSFAKASMPPPTPIHAATVTGDAFIFAGTAVAAPTLPLIWAEHAHDQGLPTANQIPPNFDRALEQGAPHTEPTSHIDPTDLHGFLLHA